MTFQTLFPTALLECMRMTRVSALLPLLKNDLRRMANNELANVDTWLRANKLSLNVAKTEFMFIGSSQRLRAQADSSIRIQIDNKEIKQVDSAKTLGLTIDETLSWSKHVNNVSKKVSSGIGALRRVRPFINEHSAEKIYKALVEPHLHYCSAILDSLSQCLSDKLQKLQNRAARIVTNSSYDTSSGPLLDLLGWDRVSITRKKQKMVVMFKTVNMLAPRYMQNMFSARSVPYNIRNSESILHVPKPRTNYLKRSLGYSGAVLWNGLPDELRKTTSLASFKKGIRNQYPKSDSHTANT